MSIQYLAPPDFDLALLKEAAARSYALFGEWHRLDGERDQNYRVVEPSGAQWVFKACNPHEPVSVMECQALALEHVARTDPALPVPRLRRTVNGELTAALPLAAGDPAIAIVLSYLPGRILGDTELSAERLRQLGATVARLGKALRGFIHPALVQRDLVWDNRLAPNLLSRIGVLPARQAEIAGNTLGDFRDRTVPRLAELRSQVIHGDVHPYNTLIDEGGELSGIIDFGDMLHAPLVQDLANLIADMLAPDRDNATTILELTRGYGSVTLLEEAEIDVLLDLMAVRLVITPLIIEARASAGVSGTGYLESFGDRCFPLLDWLDHERPSLQTLARRAAALPPAARVTTASLDDLLARRRRVLGEHLYLFYDPPLHIVKGEGVWLVASDGRRYLDCYNNVPHVGHCHPYVGEAIVRQVRRLNTNTRYLTDEAIAYAERLVETADPSLSAVLFVNSGSEANDVAWRLAKAWTGKRGGLAMDFAYHGITEATDAFSPSNAYVENLASHIRTLPPPDGYRGPFRYGEPGLGRRYAELAGPPIHDLEEKGLGVAAVMIDAAFMTNGMLEAPEGYVRDVCDRVRAAGGLFIADEVQSGFGRMGTAMWGCQHHGIVPDFITVGKPAGNGHPVGAVLTRPEILAKFTGSAAFFSTFGGNNVSCAAGLAVLDVIRDEKLVDNARIVGAYLKQGLRALMDRHELIGDVRGIGLAVGVELVRNRRTLEPARQETQRLLNLIRDEGVLVGSEGKLSNILKIRPPIVFTAEHADIAIAAIDRAFRRL
jgi:4-aminobutyrate aminotransferase-like enzyme